MDVNLLNLEKEMAKRTIKQYCSSWNELRYDEIHNKPYFIGKKIKNSETEVLCPVSSNKFLTYNQLKETIEDSGSTSVNLAIYSSDSTVVLYKAHMGLIPPVPLQVIEKRSVPDCSIIAGTSNKRKIGSTIDDPIVLTEEQIETGSTAKRAKHLSTSHDSEISVTSDNDVSEDNSNEGAK